MARPDKAAAVAELTEQFRSANAAVLTEYRGLTVAQLKELRTALGPNASYAVVKNTLTKIAVRDAGLEELADLLAGPSAIAFVTGDAVEAAKSLRDFAKDNPLLQQARTRAAQKMNGMGLMNSSMAIGAGESAMYDAAMPIAPNEHALACEAVATPAIRSMGTVGGNLCLDTRCSYYDQSEEWRRAIGFCLKKDGTVCHVVAGGKKCVAAASNDTATMLLCLDATVDIRGPQVTAEVSKVAANSGVRTEMRQRQQQWAAERGGGVIEGRDIGSVVFPDAELKLYLTASPRVRAERRVAEAGGDVDEIERSIAARDLLDSTRADSPLTEATGSATVDTTGLTIPQVLDRILQLLEPA